jgi:predicted nucleotidyltransferase
MNANFGNRKVVVKALTGSHNYNLNTPSSDRDFKFFVAPTFDDLFSGKMFSNGKQSDDLDFSVHDIRQLSHLVWKANISFVEVLFSTEGWHDARLDWIFENAENLGTMNLPAFGRATLGMMLQKSHNLFKGTEKTKPLVEKFGFDTKEATHSLRCMFTLFRVSSGMSMKNSLWFPNDSFQRQQLLDMKAGNTSLKEFQDRVDFFMGNEKSDVMAWFDAQTPNFELKEELDARVKEFVRVNVVGG